MNKGIIIMKIMASLVQSEVFSLSMQQGGVQGVGGVADEAGRERGRGQMVKSHMFHTQEFQCSQC